LETAIYLATGALVGALVTWLVVAMRLQRRYSTLEGRAGSAEAIAEERGRQVQQRDAEVAGLRQELNLERQAKVEAVTRLWESERHFREEMDRFEQTRSELTETFKALSLDALARNSDEFKKYAEDFIQLAEEKLKTQTVENKNELDSKKGLIDQNIETIGKTLSEVQKRIEDVGKVSGEKFTEVATLIKRHEEVTTRLKDTTDHLGHALASSKKRGEWGERMAEDILRLAGMAEGISYLKQKTLDTSSGRPDFTFLLPNSLKINMDVKFPLDNYMHYMNAESEHDRRRYRDELLRNAKGMIKQVTTREYINPSENTVDYVIVFVPNEQVYSFINESDPSIMDEALKQKVILCSPFTLYAVLAVIRQAVENFNLESTASEILRLLTEFSKQWLSYKEKFRIMGERLDAAKREYDTLVTTRSNMLERSLKKIDELGRQHALPGQPDVCLDEIEPVE
jgi:DNA recombination protein RmuC